MPTLEPAAMGGREVYALLSSCIVPRPIGWVSTLSRAGVRNLAPFSFFNAITTRPALVVVCVGRRRGGEQKDTARNIEETGEFVLNVVTEDLAEAMNATAAEVGPEVDEFDLAGLGAIPSARVRPARVAGCPVTLECRLHEVLHPASAPMDVILGEILLAHVDETVWRDGAVDPALLRPVGRLGGSWYCRADLFSIERGGAGGG